MAQTRQSLTGLVGGFALLLSLGSPALAVEPESLGVDSNGFVGARLLIDYPMSLVRSVLSKPVDAVRLAPDVIEVSAESQGTCDKVSVKAKGLWRPLTYVVIRCPTEAGFSERLLESDDFSAHNVEWTLAPSGSGTLVTVRSRTRIAFPVPDGMVARVAGKSLLDSLKGLDQEVSKQADATP